VAMLRPSNFAVEQTAGSHTLATAAHRGVRRHGCARAALKSGRVSRPGS